MDTSYIVYIFAAIFGIAAVIFMTRPEKKIAGFKKGYIVVLPLLVAAFAVLWQSGLLVQMGIDIPPLHGELNQYVGDQQILAVAGTSGTNGAVSTKCTYQPTASYSSIDKFGTTSVSGTSYYQKVGNKASTTALSSIDKNAQYKYWVSNTTYYVTPEEKTGNCEAMVFQADAWSNASVTLTGYDTTAHASVTDGVANCSLGANDLCNIEVTYQGTAKSSGGPFGGVMVVEYNSTISSVTATGSDLLASNPYHVTYTPSVTTHTSKQWGYAASLDDGTGNNKKINLQVKNGASAAGAGSVWYVKFIDANYYVTNAGEIVLDTERFLNDDNTRTGKNTHTLTMYWGS